MPTGYSMVTAEAIKRANSSLLGVQLGKICLKNNIPAKEVAEFFDVSRMTVYNWFAGTHEPQRLYASAINTLLNSLQ